MTPTNMLVGEFDRGYISAYFVTNADKMEASVDDPYLLITDKKTSAGQDILPLLEQLTQQGSRVMSFSKLTRTK